MAKGRVHKNSQANPGRLLTQEELAEIDPDKPLLVPNRRNKRQSKIRGSIVGTTSVHDTLRIGVSPWKSGKTGQPEWFRRLKYEAETKKILSKVSLDRLEPAVGRVAMDLYAAGYRTVWDVSRVKDAKEFMKHGTVDDPGHGVRSRDLKKLRDYLIRQNIDVKWSL